MKPETELRRVRRAVAGRLSRAGIEAADLEARHIIRAVLGVADSAWLDPVQPLNEAQLHKLESLCQRREAREPLSQILGQWGFWSLDLQVSTDVLTPRPETECLVQKALRDWPEPPVHLVDLGTGSGAIALALLSEWPGAQGTAVDISSKALDIARANAARLGLTERLTFLQGGWNAALGHGPFDLLICNPPYIRQGDMGTLMPEVRDFEPDLALSGGTDGLDAYRVIVPLLAQYLTPGGRFVLETGEGQGKEVCALVQVQAGLDGVHMAADLAGRQRMVCGLRTGDAK